MGSPDGYHWTDQKLRVHAFYCVLALMIMSLLRRQLARAGIPMSIVRIAERLGDIYEVVNLYPTPKGAKPRLQISLSKCDARQAAMLEAPNPSRYLPH